MQIHQQGFRCFELAQSSNKEQETNNQDKCTSYLGEENGE